MKPWSYARSSGFSARSKDILEIGTFDGNTTLNLAANAASGATVTTVDLPPDWDGTYLYHVPDDYVNVTSRTAIGCQYRDTPYAAMIEQVYGDSAGLDWNRLGSGRFDLSSSTVITTTST